MAVFIPNTRKKKKPICRIPILPKKFYASAYRDEYNPSGLMRLYRMTLNNPSDRTFTYQSVRIKNPEELARVKPALDYLAGKLGWEQLPPLLEELEKQLKQDTEFDPTLKRLVEQYPRAVAHMVKLFDTAYHGKTELEDFDVINEFMVNALQAITGKQETMVNILIDLINKLGEEKTPEGIQRLLRLMEEHSLPEITTVASIITSRLQKLKLFEATIQNENAYEIKGINSVQDQLAKAMWMLDDAYWLLHSNEPLENFLSKKYPSSVEGKKRPDFICVSNEYTIVIVEIKRPSHELTMNDVTQLQDYIATIEEHRPDFKVKEGYIIGKTMSDHNQRMVNNIKNIHYKPYTKLVDDCQRRYREYLDAIEKTSQS